MHEDVPVTNENTNFVCLFTGAFILVEGKKCTKYGAYFLLPSCWVSMLLDLQCLTLCHQLKLTLPIALPNLVLDGLYRVCSALGFSCSMHEQLCLPDIDICSHLYRDRGLKRRSRSPKHRSRSRSKSKESKKGNASRSRTPSPPKLAKEGSTSPLPNEKSLSR